MYNGFIGSATNDLALNNVFGEFKSEVLMSFIGFTI